MEPLDGWTGGVPGAQMCVRAYVRRVSVVDVRVFCAWTRGERLLGVINIIRRGTENNSVGTSAKNRIEHVRYLYK
jgi:hypothetical protein